MNFGVKVGRFSEPLNTPFTMRSSRTDTVIRSVLEGTGPIRVQGSTPTARALILARLARHTNMPCVVICADDDCASELASDIETLSREVDGENLTAHQLPGWEHSPYSPVTPSLRSRLARIATLSRLIEEAGPSIVVTTIAAASQATLPPEIFRQNSLRIAVDQSVGTREELTRRLVSAGYLRIDPVEDPGTFAVRGEIIDVFPPGRERPIRIELFDDVVERIREYDPATQRASSEGTGELKQVVLPPAREVLINPDTQGRIRERLKAWADDAGIPRTVRDPVIESIQDGIYPDHSDTWAPFAYERSSNIWDYLPSGGMVIWNDELSCQQRWDEFLTEQKRLADEAPTSGTLAPPVDRLFLWSPEIENIVRDRSRLYLDQLELADLQTVEDEEEPSADDPDRPSSRILVKVIPNQDLRSQNRSALTELETKFQNWRKQGFRTLVLASTQSQLDRIRFLLEELGLPARMQPQLEPSGISLALGTVSAGFRWPAEKLVVLTEEEVLGTKYAKRQRRIKTAESGSAAREWSGLQALSDLAVGDAIVHIDHGIGRYQGLVRLDLSGAPSDFLLIEYANKDKLYLPVYRLNVIQKYVGTGESVALDRLGAQQFAKAKERVRNEVRKLAIDLVRLYAERKIREGHRFSPRDSSFREFEAKFAFDETPDQAKAIEDTLADMETGKVMDRLVCGDVGYGKTEVAIRAAFKAVSDGKQVAVLVPTTVLAHQHEQSFRTRLKDYPLNIESISRFKSPKSQKSVLAALAQGKVDIVIGTHRLLSKDVEFRDLGLLIVDEEHRFGVEHKERPKALKVNTSVLTLTATPIPRTLHMALAGLRDISLINTPPVDRLPIRTYVSKFDDALLKRAIEFEINRGGQVFFVHNRVQSIYELANKIRELVPQAQISIAHGQMPEKELESSMLAFYEKRSNVLVCTSIIESGLDVPSANTIIVNRADAFGLAQLYQIRGRVGRGQQRAYAYLLLPAAGAISDDAKKRLEVIQRFVELGSGFSIASHDLEIRGGGDLLGAEQSGHIAAVGFDLYTELLEEAIQELQGKQTDAASSRKEPEIKAPFPAFLSEQYVPDVHQRLSLYRRLSGSRDEGELRSLEEELRDRFGPVPAEAQNLLWLIRVKQLLKRTGIEILTVGPEKVSLVPGPANQADPARLIALVASDPDSYQLTPDSRFIAKISTQNLSDLYFGLERLLQKILPRSMPGTTH